jgi:glutamate synthase domain-containing protein 3
MAEVTAPVAKDAAEQERIAREMGMHTEQLSGRSQRKFFDIDLAEQHSGFSLPNAFDVDFNKRAEIDASNMPEKEVNLRIRELMKDGYGTIVIRNPGAKHSIAVGILNRLNLIIDGSLGYFGVGLIDGPNVRIAGRVGWACAENMMSGTILIEKNAGSQFGAAIRGGDLVCRGNVGSRTGIDMKGGTIIVGGDTGAFTGFMMQRGRMVICGNSGKNLGDSMYDGTIFIGGEPASLGVDAVWGEMTDLDRKWLERKLAMYELQPKSGIGHFRKIVAGKQLWNYDNLEPTEKKLVL